MLFSKEIQEKIDNLTSEIELTSKMKDLTNQRQGQLTFIKPAYKKNNRMYWWTICDCGEIELTRSDAKKQHCQKCAHIASGQTNKGRGMNDLTNQKFGKLTPLYPLEERYNQKIVWHCKCDCGKEVDVLAASLTSGNTQSCGCIRRENNYFSQFKENLVGQTFGYLTVLEETDQRQYEKIVWKCQCECGKIVYLNTTRLKSGNDTSCGCKKNSLGAANITKILDLNNIKYIKEYTEPSLNLKRFDFALLNEQNQVIKLIEFDGEQHFKATGGWNTEENVERNKIRDKIKNQWALEHNIPLVRIPYWERDNITLEMIMGDKYLVKAEDA